MLRLNKQTSSDKVASVFKQGREAEKVLTLDVEASVRLANGETIQSLQKSTVLSLITHALH